MCDRRVFAREPHVALRGPDGELRTVRREPPQPLAVVPPPFRLDEKTARATRVFERAPLVRLAGAVAVDDPLREVRVTELVDRHHRYAGRLRARVFVGVE